VAKEEGFDEMQTISACGFAAGVMAQRSIKRGAWVAPANEILVGVLGLTQDYSREDLLDFQANAINPLRNEPVGFMALSSETLSRDFELSSINVRRLLSLLRRLALKHGNEYVFETNNEQFRRQVQQGFASLLDLMFTRGAFAGKTPATSYQVVVSDALNHPRSVDQGRLIVELKVAPSQPLKFVTVRLAQTGGKSEVSEIV
jgi:phage tail sheath protein FI